MSIAGTHCELHNFSELYCMCYKWPVLL